MAYPYNSNSYYTPYSYNTNGNYGYNQQSYQQNYQQMNNYQPNQNSYSNYQQGQMQQAQTIYYPLTYVNGIEGAKAFIVQPNQIIYLKDSDSDILYEKKSDEKGISVLKAFKLQEIDLTSNNANKQPIQQNANYITNDILMNQIANLENNFDNKINKINEKINSLSKQSSNPNTPKGKNGERNEQ